MLLVLLEQLLLVQVLQEQVLLVLLQATLVLRDLLLVLQENLHVHGRGRGHGYGHGHGRGHGHAHFLLGFLRCFRRIWTGYKSSYSLFVSFCS